MLQIRKHNYIGNAERQDVLPQDGSRGLPPYRCAAQTVPKGNVAITDGPQAGSVVLFKNVVHCPLGAGFGSSIRHDDEVDEDNDMVN